MNSRIVKIEIFNFVNLGQQRRLPYLPHCELGLREAPQHFRVDEIFNFVKLKKKRFLIKTIKIALKILNVGWDLLKFQFFLHWTKWQNYVVNLHFELGWPSARSPPLKFWWSSPPNSGPAGRTKIWRRNFCFFNNQISLQNDNISLKSRFPDKKKVRFDFFLFNNRSANKTAHMVRKYFNELSGDLTKVSIMSLTIVPMPVTHNTTTVSNVTSLVEIGSHSESLVWEKKRFFITFD